MRALLLLAVLVLVTPGAEAGDLFLTPSPAFQCLTSVPGAPSAPEYPEGRYEAGESMSVKVELQFSAPDQAPKLRFFQTDLAGGAFANAVADYAKYLRLPCMQPGAAPVRLEQRYDFELANGHKFVRPTTTDPADAERMSQLQCMHNAAGNEKPIYPRAALTQGAEAKVLVHMQFNAPQQAPEYKIIKATGLAEFADNVADYVKDLRVPCMKGGPIGTNLTFKFFVEGEARNAFKDMGLKTLIGMASAVPRPAHFDLRNMACPFAVRVTYFQPYQPNGVQQLDQYAAEREPFMQWLAAVKLRVPEDKADSLFGESFTLQVPCATINL